MTTDVQDDQTTVEAEPGPTSNYAIFFELEGFAADGKEATFKVLQSLLQGQGAKLDAGLFSRYCLDPFPENYLGDLLDSLGGAKPAINKLVKDVKSGVLMELTSKSTKLDPAFKTLLEMAQKKGITLATLSSLPEDKAQNLVDGLGLTDYGVQLFAFCNQEASFPGADCWLKMAKAVGKTSFHCAVLASSQTAAKSALSAGMCCAVVPDKYTSFQDFSGVNAIFDTLDDVDVNELLTTLCPHLGA